MSAPVAIVVGAVIIAAAVALTSHWSIEPVSGRVGAFRLNRWTGDVVWCGFTGNAIPSYLDCRAEDWQAVGPKPQDAR